MDMRTWHPGLWLYVTVAMAALLIWIPNSADPEAAGLLLIVMLVITFPAGLVLAVALALGARVLYELHVTASFGVVGHVLTWVLLLCVGFLQWRYLAPWVIRKLQTHGQP